MLIKKNYPNYNADFSLLYYIFNNEFQIIETNNSDWFNIVFERNFIVNYQKRSKSDCYLKMLPDLLCSARNCNMCEMS